MAASDYVSMLFKNRLHLAGTRPVKAVDLTISISDQARLILVPVLAKSGIFGLGPTATAPAKRKVFWHSAMIRWRVPGPSTPHGKFARREVTISPELPQLGRAADAA